MKRTPLHEEHLRLDAKIVPFAGYEMPIQYTSILDEHKAVREHVGLFDVSHMGEIEIKGQKAVEFADMICSNNVREMKPGDIKYTVICNEDGGVIDDLFIHFISVENIFLVVNASNTDKDFNWIKSHEIAETTVTNLSESFTELALQGPEAYKVMKKITDFDSECLPYFTFTNEKVAGVPALIARTGYTGEDGFELYIDNAYAQKLWKAIMDAGEEFSIKPVGLGARDTLRFEVCYWLYGNELDETINPIEAGQKFVIDFDKDFIGKEAIESASQKGGRKRKLTCLKLLDKGGIPRHGFDVFNEKADDKIGFVTSGGLIPSTGYIGAMAYLPFGKGYKTGKHVKIEIRGKMLDAEIIKKPFYKGTAGKVRSGHNGQR